MLTLHYNHPVSGRELEITFAYSRPFVCFYVTGKDSFSTSTHTSLADATHACKIDAALHPHRKRFILTADGWQYAIRYRKLSSPFRFCHDALPLQPQYQRQVREALC
jgi:hypothetical protein|nr:MAG TPA: FKBP-type peptidyl-prolyl cis-trans isomerase [Caudoviricetes sp.]